MGDIRAFIRKEITTILKEDQQQQGVRPDVATVAKVTASNKSLQTAQKRINDLPEFEQAFSQWISQLGLEPDKFTLANVRDRVAKVLQQLGYK